MCNNKDTQDNSSFKYWAGTGHILISSSGWECFLHNAALNPLINWLNLHRAEIQQGDPCEGMDKINEVTYITVKGFLTIVTNRDVVTLGKQQVPGFVAWLNKHRKILRIREVWG